MRHFEIVCKGLSKSEPPEFPLRTATLFVARREGIDDPFISLVKAHGGRIIKTRVLVRHNGFSIDVELPDPASAVDLLFAWQEYSRSRNAAF